MEVCLVALTTWSTTSPLLPISIVADVVSVPSFNRHTESHLSKFAQSFSDHEQSHLGGLVVKADCRAVGIECFEHNHDTAGAGVCSAEICNSRRVPANRRPDGCQGIFHSLASGLAANQHAFKRGYGMLYQVCNQKLDDIRIPAIAWNGDRITAK